MSQTDRSASRHLLHIITEGNWANARRLGVLSDPSLESEGFIHCSYADQVLLPANALFAGQTDLLLLAIDPSQLSSPLLVEDSYGSGNEFPHVYGPIELAAVITTFPFPPNEDGSFLLPTALDERESGI